MPTPQTFTASGVTYVARDLDGRAAAAFWAEGTLEERARRRMRRGYLLGFVVLAAGAVIGLGGGAWVITATLPDWWLTLPLAIVAAALIGAIRIWTRSGARVSQPAITQVPPVVLDAAARAEPPLGHAKLWRLATAFNEEARLRETVEYDVNIDRGSDIPRAARAREQYAAAYRAYDAAALELGVAPLPAAVSLV